MPQATFEQELLSAIEAVHRFAVHLVRDAARAEDLVQETYLQALAHRHQYEPGTNCRAWLFTICRHLHLKRGARADREVATEDAALEALAAAGVHAGMAGTDPEGALFERPELAEVVGRALARLPEEYRAVVALIDIEDQSYADAARVLGVPVGTVRSRLFRGRRLLQEDLLAYAEDAGLIQRRKDAT
jgi:RNA polymerase sigma-70 factor (ECF subfamily)